MATTATIEGGAITRLRRIVWRDHDPATTSAHRPATGTRCAALSPGGDWVSPWRDIVADKAGPTGGRSRSDTWPRSPGRWRMEPLALGHAEHGGSSALASSSRGRWHNRPRRGHNRPSADDLCASWARTALASALAGAAGHHRDARLCPRAGERPRARCGSGNDGFRRRSRWPGSSGSSAAVCLVRPPRPSACLASRPRPLLREPQICSSGGGLGAVRV
jgi:hypothetical protein